MSAVACTHLDQITITSLPDPIEGCEECLKIGGRWLHLRMCQSCGKIGCCDSSPNRHASKHAAEVGHPIVALGRARRGLELVLRRRGRVHRRLASSGWRTGGVSPEKQGDTPSFVLRGRSLCRDEAVEERERRVGDLPPAAVDRERVAAVRDLDDLGHALVALLLLERRVRDRPRDGVVLLAGDDQERPALGVLRVDLRPRSTG